MINRIPMRPFGPTPQPPIPETTESIAPPAIHPETYTPTSPVVEKIIAALRQVYDPEIPVNIYDLGLIYSIDVEGGFASINMTLTAPGCPVAGEMPGMVSAAAETVEEIKETKVTLVWQPAWDKTRMSEDARLALGFL